MAIEDTKTSKLNFLYKLVNGAANKSYGIQVAKLAGLPGSIVKRASQLLISHESNQEKQNSSLPLFDFVDTPEATQEYVDPEILKLQDEIKSFSLSEVTPLQALNKIAEWQQNL